MMTKVSNNSNNFIPSTLPIEKIRAKWESSDILIKNQNGENLSKQEKNDLINVFPEEISFLVKSGLIFKISGFHNTDSKNREDHYIKYSTDSYGNQSLMIRVENTWTPISDIIKNFEIINEIDTKSLQKRGSPTRWTYLAEGLSPTDQFYYPDQKDSSRSKELKPCLSLTKTGYKQLLASAQTFNEAASKGTCILQFVTNPQVGKGRLSSHNQQKEAGAHVGIRLIKENGDVYSTGLSIDLEERKCYSGKSRRYTTSNGQPIILDTEEFRVHDGRITTNIAITSDQAEKLLQKLNQQRVETTRFNMITQNCVRFAVSCAKECGVDNIDVIRSLADKIYGQFPSLTDPLGLRPIRRKINKTIKGTKIEPVANVVSKVADAVKFLAFFPVRLAVGAVIHSAIFLMGITRQTKNKQRKNNSLEGLSDFERISPWQLLNPYFTLYDSTKFIQWQLKQNSTVVTPYTGNPAMNIVPPVKVNEEFRDSILERYEI